MTAYFVACSVLADILFVLTTTSSLHKLRVYAFTPIDLGLAGNGKEKDTCRNGQQVTSQQLCHLIETGINQQHQLPLAFIHCRWIVYPAPDSHRTERTEERETLQEFSGVISLLSKGPSFVALSQRDARVTLHILRCGEASATPFPPVPSSIQCTLS